METQNNFGFPSSYTVESLGCDNGSHRSRPRDALGTPGGKAVGNDRSSRRTDCDCQSALNLRPSQCLSTSFELRRSRSQQQERNCWSLLSVLADNSFILDGAFATSCNAITINNVVTVEGCYQPRRSPHCENIKLMPSVCILYGQKTPTFL
jgi:hypothetical protein